MAGLWYAYSKVPMLMGANGARQDEAETFLHDRASCGGAIDCLSSAYRQRIGTLKAHLDGAMSRYARLEDAPPTCDNDVAAIVSGYAAKCASLGGALATGANRPWTMTADLDNDGVPDYVLNTQNLECSGSATAFCGNGGCRIDIALSRDGYVNPTSALGGQPTLVQTEAGTSLQVWVDGIHCGLSGGSHGECWATYQWTDGRLETRYSVRPAAN
jgi:uncharacterized protein